MSCCGKYQSDSNFNVAGVLDKSIKKFGGIHMRTPVLVVHVLAYCCILPSWSWIQLDTVTKRTWGDKWTMHSDIRTGTKMHDIYTQYKTEHNKYTTHTFFNTHWIYATTWTNYLSTFNMTYDKNVAHTHSTVRCIFLYRFHQVHPLVSWVET